MTLVYRDDPAAPAEIEENHLAPSLSRQRSMSVTPLGLATLGLIFASSVVSAGSLLGAVFFLRRLVGESGVVASHLVIQGLRLALALAALWLLVGFAGRLWGEIPGSLGRIARRRRSKAQPPA